MRADRRVAAVVWALLCFAPNPASAYCRTTTCDAGGSGDCLPDASGCSTQGFALFWATACMGYGMQRDGSPKLGITADDANARIGNAFVQWMNADCGGAVPSFRVWDYSPIVCNKIQYNSESPNANAWMFRDTDWPYVGSSTTLALTTVTFKVKTGEILDADVELNSFGTRFVLNDTDPGTDLESIAAHEAGHFLGLAHSANSEATMFSPYTPNDRTLRSLDLDDQAGICAIYPPGRDVPACDTPMPLNGFSRECGTGNVAGDESTKGCTCSLPTTTRSSAWGGLLGAALLGLAAASRRRRR